ncbi:MAG: TonB family protein [Flavobacteriales bacterium]|nr:TonB family protein [Flavobacteriales bacterium]
MKTEKAAGNSIESRKSVMFYIGLSVALALAMMAFEYRTPKDHSLSFEKPANNDWLIEEEVIPITSRKMKVPELPEPEREKENKASLDQQMKIVVEKTKPISSHLKPSELPDIPIDFRYFDEGEDPDIDKDVDISNDIWDEPIPGYLPSFCECAQLESEVEREACNTQYLNSHLRSNLRFPEKEKMAGRQGSVLAVYVINTTGKVENIQIIRSPSEGFSTEAKRVIQQMPCIVPASQHNHNIAVKYSIPINFVLNP